MPVRCTVQHISREGTSTCVKHCSCLSLSALEGCVGYNPDSPSAGWAAEANSCCMRGVQVMWFALQLLVLGTNYVEITCHKQFFLIHLL